MRYLSSPGWHPIVLIAFSVFLPPSAFAEIDSIAPVSNQNFQMQEFKFETKQNSRSQQVGNLKLSEVKDAVLLQFEGTGLKKGKYKILKVSDCEKLKANPQKMKSLEDEEIFLFETEYGEISTEKKLEAKTVSDFNASEGQLALVMVQKNKLVLVACESR